MKKKKKIVIYAKSRAHPTERIANKKLALKFREENGQVDNKTYRVAVNVKLTFASAHARGPQQQQQQVIAGPRGTDEKKYSLSECFEYFEKR